ncbi:response regulator transcription factor [Brachybacterium sp. 107]|uniref:response regulator transcription factor n=1 Tax=Brachybacterium sp. 107 TaxID=3457736 RepID=UPI004034B38D
MDRRVAVVVEDDEDIRELMVALLGQSGFTVHEAGTGTAGVAAVRENEPVVVTVDLGLPDIDGFEVTRQVRQFSDAYVVMLTARTEEIDTLLGLEVGADDYVTKPFRPRELRARIEAMMRRPRVGRATPVTPASPTAPSDATAGGPAGSLVADAPAPTVHDPAGRTGAAAGSVTGAPMPTAASAAEFRLESEGLELYPNLHQVVADGREVPLTPTEFVLLETLMHSGQVVRSKAELARTLRGDEAGDGTFVSGADERTVEVHLGNLRRKLADDAKEPRWVQTVRGVGYRMAGGVRGIR